MLMFGLELDRRLKAAGSPVQSIPAHPGVASTDVTRRGRPGRPCPAAPGQSHLQRHRPVPDPGRIAPAVCRSSSDAKGGIYYGPEGVREARGYPTEAEIAP
ncbi:hypothetical protein DC522_25425 [Microvirga sp. KLBC 81]|nr:hypothetical protein DC522_25425 [Microvirga sp. KLBC 81]